MDQIEIDNQSGGTQGNLLNNVEDFNDGFNGSNFDLDLQSVQGYSQNQYNPGNFYANNNAQYGGGASNAFGIGRVLSQADSN